MEYYASELELNAKFHTFATNSSILFRGHNTVQAQLKYKNKRGEQAQLKVSFSVKTFNEWLNTNDQSYKSSFYLMDLKLQEIISLPYIFFL